MPNIHVILISSVPPEPTSAGQLILHRHLVHQPGITWECFGSEPSRLTASSAVRRLIGRLAQTRLRRFAHDFWALRNGRWLDGLLPNPATPGDRTVVLTVAQGDACGAARRFAQKRRLPLVTFFHDWWPEMPDVHSCMRERLERQFRQLYQDSIVSFCVSEGMLEALGSNPAAQVLLPIPEKRTSIPCAGRRQGPFRLLYSGNLYEYGPMLGEALEVLSDSAEVRLEVRGRKPRWYDGLKNRAAAAGTWFDFAPRSELNAWLETADAFLVTMSFDPALRRRMETSFPSKIPEMAQFGKPLVIWGPEYCSAVRWARQQNYALCVTDSNAKALLQELGRLAIAPEEQRRLAVGARQAAQTDFDPDKIQAQYVGALRGALPAVKHEA